MSKDNDNPIISLVDIKESKKEEFAIRIAQSALDVVEAMSDHFGDNLSGYAMVAWDNNGRFMAGAYCGPPCSPIILPSVVQEVLRKYFNGDLANLQPNGGIN